MRKLGALCALALYLCGCRGYLDPRCYEEHYYCLTSEPSRVFYLRSVSDTRLIALARLEYRTSRPPTAFDILNEMERRGPSRARAIVYQYASGPIDRDLLDEMTRELTTSPVCAHWYSSAPMPARKHLLDSCERVHGSQNMEQLRAAADQMRHEL